MSTLDIVQVPVLSDNYIYLVHERTTGATAVVDPAVAGPVRDALRRHGWTLNQIWITHHHHDHTGGIPDLLTAFPDCQVVGAGHDAERIPGITRRVREGDRVDLGAAAAEVLEVPGHTTGHVAYVLRAVPAVFCGDTLFSLGCGRMFEGTPEGFWASLCKLRALPDDTLVYCAHEYTASNHRFAAHVDAGNADLAARGARVVALREHHQPTVPSVLGEEKRANPFLRADDPTLAAAIGMAGQPPAAVFGALRRQKDSF